MTLDLRHLRAFAVLGPRKVRLGAAVAPKTIVDPEKLAGYSLSASDALAAVQEQNSHAGATNRMLARKAACVCVAYDGMDRYFPREKVLLTGNPVRQDVVDLVGKRPRGMEHFGLREGAPVVLVTGGSLGARGINRGIEAGLSKLRDAGAQLIWQTGTPFLKQARAAISALDWGEARVLEFIDRMDLAYAVADLVVARAGAISVRPDGRPSPRQGPGTAMAQRSSRLTKLV